VRKGARGGRPPAFDRERYRQRNQVERLMNRRKQFRAVATRFDKLAVRYQATVAVADIFIWLRARPDRSRSDPRNTPSSIGCATQHRSDRYCFHTGLPTQMSLPRACVGLRSNRPRRSATPPGVASRSG
jgi:hypothetical protein